MKEAQNINKSLAALGDVLRALAKTQKHIPSPLLPCSSMFVIRIPCVKDSVSKLLVLRSTF